MEDFADKTEAPTPRRRLEAREQGMFARSHELSAAIVILGALVLIHFNGSELMRVLQTLVATSLTTLADDSAQPVQWVLLAGKALLPLAAGVLALAVMVNLAQSGFRLFPKRIGPDLSALKPKRRGDAMARLVLGLLKVGVLSIASFWIVRDQMDRIAALSHVAFSELLSEAGPIVFAVGIRLGIVLLVLGLGDYGYQRWRLERQLRMTRREVKEEMKRMEGDPQLKRHRRQLALQLSQQRLSTEVPKADVLLVDGDRVAVAIRYDAESMPAPRVLAKGQHLIAQRIRKIATANGVPIVERQELARILFQQIAPGQPLPKLHYAAVAETLAYAANVKQMELN